MGERQAARLIEAGNAAEDAGRVGEALASYEAAVRACPAYARAHLNRGNALGALGRNDEALAAYSDALTHAPHNAGAHVNIGNLLLRIGRADDAVKSYRRAVAIDPSLPLVYLALGMTLRQLGRPEEAIESLRASTMLTPDSIDACIALGSVLLGCGRLEEALAAYRQAANLDPANPEIACNLGNVLFSLGKYGEAIDAFRSAARSNPRMVVAHVALGRSLRASGRSAEAVASFRRAVEIDSESVEAYRNLGLALRDIGQPSDAIDAFDEALRRQPQDAAARTALGCLLHELGNLEGAIAQHREALAVDPAVEVRNNLANALKDSGRFAEAIEHYRDVLRIRPDFWPVHSNLLLAMNYRGSNPSECLECARTFGALLASSVPARSDRARLPAPQRLRVGIVSGDLRAHPVGYFLEALLAHVRNTSLDLVAYPTFGTRDELTERIAPSFVDWKPLTGMSDEATARMIQSDGIHILLDLSGHTAHNRLPIFARKPAPVQASWLGYFATTGVHSMDYVLGDPYVAPKTEAAHFTERLWHLPDCYLCFTPPAFPVAVGPLPALSTGGVTFGCFNNLAKMNDDVVRLWARLLRQIPGSKLLLKTIQLADATVREATFRRFEAADLPRDRVTLDPPSPRAQLLAAYNRVDIALDPFPYPGGTTTAEAYWMGVPTITRKGDRFLSHVGESIARAAGMPDWIADDDHDYVTKAVAFASDLPRLARIRASLRAKVLASPLFDSQRYARAFEKAMWGMWDTYVNEAGAQ